MKLLVIGINIRHIACSACRAGHEVHAVDGYCDLDLGSCALDMALLSRDGLDGADGSDGQDRTEELISEHIERVRPQAVVLGPGLEEARVKGVPVLNNPAEKVARISDKLWQARWLEENGFPFIKTVTSGQELDFPVMIKPRRGAGGVGCRIAEDRSHLDWEEGLIAQEIVSGQAASVSVIGDGKRARALAANEQLIGEGWTGAKGFRYCGNITPLEPLPKSDIARMAERIVARLGLLGSNGVDFLLTEEGPVVVEVNCRFQGSLDTVECATGVNVFEAHLNSFRGLLPSRPTIKCTAGRAIVYAPATTEIKKRMLFPWTADVPRPGSMIGRDDPILSVLAKGSNRGEVLSRLKERAAMIRQLAACASGR
ncbi:MAG: ATP-grasp domain-containing protein [Methanothrix sp.]